MPPDCMLRPVGWCWSSRSAPSWWQNGPGALVAPGPLHLFLLRSAATAPDVRPGPAERISAFREPFMALTMQGPRKGSVCWRANSAAAAKIPSRPHTRPRCSARPDGAVPNHARQRASRQAQSPGTGQQRSWTRLRNDSVHPLYPCEVGTLACLLPAPSSFVLSTPPLVLRELEATPRKVTQRAASGPMLLAAADRVVRNSPTRHAFLAIIRCPTAETMPCHAPLSADLDVCFKSLQERRASRVRSFGCAARENDDRSAGAPLWAAEDPGCFAALPSSVQC